MIRSAALLRAPLSCAGASGAPAQATPDSMTKAREGKGGRGKRRANPCASPDLRVAVAPSAASAPGQGCVVFAAGLTEARAASPVARWLTATNAKPVEPERARGDFAWRGSYQDVPLHFAVWADINLGTGLGRGAGIPAVRE